MTILAAPVDLLKGTLAANSRREAPLTSTNAAPAGTVRCTLLATNTSSCVRPSYALSISAHPKLAAAHYPMGGQVLQDAYTYSHFCASPHLDNRGTGCHASPTRRNGLKDLNRRTTQASHSGSTAACLLTSPHSFHPPIPSLSQARFRISGAHLFTYPCMIIYL
jgi:hypothetical protein